MVPAQFKSNLNKTEIKQLKRFTAVFAFLL